MSEHGYALVPAVVLAVFVGVVGLLIVQQSDVKRQRAVGAHEAFEAERVAEAAIAHARFRLRAADCAGYTNLTSTPLASAAYDVTVAPTAGSPVALVATATTASGTRHQIKRLVDVESPAIETLLLQPTMGRDTFVQSGPHSHTHGDRADINFAAGSSRPLIAFDLAQLAANAQVVDATLELYSTALTYAGELEVSRVVQAWDAVEANWTEASSGSAWTDAGGAPQVAAAATATFTSSNAWVRFDVTPLVKRWQAGTANHGFVISALGAATGRFAASEHTTGAWRPRLRIRYGCLCGELCLAANGFGSVLLVVPDAASLGGDDAAKTARFEAWGYSVTPFSASASAAEFATETANHDVVYVSETAGASDVDTKLVDLEIGVVIEQPSLYDEFGLATGSGQTSGTSIEIVDVAHEITEPLLLGTLAIFSASNGGAHVTGTPAPGLVELARWGADGALTVLERGAILTDGGTARGRRASLPLGRAADVEWSQITVAGELLIQRTIEWAKGGNVALCDADFVPIAKDKAFVYSADGSQSVRGLAFLPAGAPFGATIAPAGGAWIAAAPSALVLFDAGGAVLDQLATQPELTGATRVSAGALVGRIAVTRRAGSRSYLEFIDPQGLVPTSSFELGGGIALPSGVAFLSGTAGGTYEGKLAIADEEDERVYLVEPDGNVLDQIVLPTGVIPTGVAHLPGTDKLLVADGANSQALTVDFDGNVAATYPLSGFGLVGPEAVAVHPETCHHVFANDAAPLALDLDEVASLDDIPSVPIAHWPLDEPAGTVAVDIVGGHDANVVTPAWVDGRINGGLSFDGNVQRVSVDTTDLQMDGSFSLAAWVWLATEGKSQAILGLGDTVATANYWLGIQSDSLVGGYRAAGGAATFKAPEKLGTGRWYHAAMSFDVNADLVRLYVDGLEVRVSEAIGPPVPTGTTVWIGHVDPDGTFDGVLDDVRIYDRWLSPGEIALLANAPIPPVKKPLPPELAIPDPLGCAGTLVDLFDSPNYGNNDGTLLWAGDWTEINENDGAKKGDERIVTHGSAKVLRLQDNDGGGEGVWRGANLGGRTSATLTVHYWRNGLVDNDDSITLSVSANGGKSWTDIQKFMGPANDDAGSLAHVASHDVSAYATADFRVRFLTSASNGRDAALLVDRLAIQVTCD